MTLQRFSNARTCSTATAGADTGSRLPPITTAARKIAVAGLLALGAMASLQLSAARATGPCPNEPVRLQQGATALPDCRAYEMVSPPDKNGGDVRGIDGVSGGGVVQASADGQSVTYLTLNAFGDAKSAPVGSQHVAGRSAGAGWSTQNIGIPINSGTYGVAGEGTPFEAFSLDLSSGVLWSGEVGANLNSEQTPVENPPFAGAPAGYEDFYLYAIPGGGLQSLLTRAPAAPAGEFSMRFLGATPDLSHVVVSSSAALNSGEEGGHPELYEWDRTTGVFQPVSVLPDGAPREHAGLGGRQEGEVDHAVSEDGSRVIWTSGG